MSFLRRKKPFLIPATILSFVLLIMAIVTKRYISYTNIGIFGSYTPVDGDNEAFCNEHVFRALKVTQFTSSNPDPLDLKTYAMCPWEQNTGKIFLAAASLMCLWSLIELFLAYKSKFYIFFNIIDVFVLALGSVAAGYMLNDIQQDTGNCSDVDALNTAGATSTPFYRCNRSLYDVAFILLILNLALWLFQLIYNIVRRKVQNEHKQEEIGYSSVPAHQSVPTDPHGVPVNTAGEAGTSANRLP